MCILNSGGIHVRKRLICLLQAALCLLLSSCGCETPAGQVPTQLRVVTEIGVYYKNGPLFAQRTYRNEEKMRQVLTYLRTVDAYGTPGEDPEAVSGSEFQIYLYFSDGSRKRYLQRADRYLQVDSGPWKKIDPKKAEELSRILSYMESDP